MDLLPINSMYKRTNGFPPVYFNIQEWESLVFFNIHGETDMKGLVIKASEEIIKVVFSM